MGSYRSMGSWEAAELARYRALSVALILARVSTPGLWPLRLPVFPFKAALIFAHVTVSRFLPVQYPGLPFIALLILAIVSGLALLPFLGLGFPFLDAMIFSRITGSSHLRRLASAILARVSSLMLRPISASRLASSGLDGLPLFQGIFPLCAALIRARVAGVGSFWSSPPFVEFVSREPLERKKAIQKRSASCQWSLRVSSSRKMDGFRPNATKCFNQQARWSRFILQSLRCCCKRYFRVLTVFPIYRTDWSRGSSRA